MCAITVLLVLTGLAGCLAVAAPIITHLSPTYTRWLDWDRAMSGLLAGPSESPSSTPLVCRYTRFGRVLDRARRLERRDTGRDDRGECAQCDGWLSGSAGKPAERSCNEMLV